MAVNTGFKFKIVDNILKKQLHKKNFWISLPHIDKFSLHWYMNKTICKFLEKSMNIKKTVLYKYNKTKTDHSTKLGAYRLSCGSWSKNMSA